MTNLNTYLVVLGKGFDMEQVLTKIDQYDSIVNWLYYLPRTLLIVTTGSLSWSRDIVKALGEIDCRFVVVQVQKEQAAGYMPKSFWEAIGKPDFAKEL